MGTERNIKLTVEYDGTDFAGWQRQKGRRTVQQVIEEAIARVTGARVSLVASGRTDSGVHAEGQVANFRTTSRLSCERLLAGINSNLDDDVAVLSVEDAAPDFHSNRDAVRKVYRYTISLAPVRPVRERRYLFWSRFPLDVKAMRRAARHMVGTHDFNSFRAEGRVEKNTVRMIERIDFEREGDTLRICFTGDGFLYMMVRIMVGTLLEVGRGRISPAEIPGIIAARDRRKAGATARPQGLCLVAVEY